MQPTVVFKPVLNPLQGTFDLTGAGTSDNLLTVLRETRPLPVAFLTGVGIHSMSRYAIILYPLAQVAPFRTLQVRLFAILCSLYALGLVMLDQCCL